MHASRVYTGMYCGIIFVSLLSLYQSHSVTTFLLEQITLIFVYYM